MRDLSTAQRGSESGNRPIKRLFGVNDRTTPGNDELLKGLGALDRPVDGTFGIHEQEGGSERSDEARRCSVRGVAIFGSFRSHRISMMSFARVQGIRTNKNFFLREKVRFEVPLDTREMLHRAQVVRDDALRSFDRVGLR